MTIVKEPLRKGGNASLKKAAKAPSFAREEYKKVQSEIAALLEQRGSVQRVWNHLYRTGRLTMCYHTFWSYVRADGHRSVWMKKVPPTTSTCDLCDILDFTELEAYHPQADFGQDLNTIYHRLVDLGVVSSGYSDFCDHFQEP